MSTVGQNNFRKAISLPYLENSKTLKAKNKKKGSGYLPANKVKYVVNYLSCVVKDMFT